MSDVISIALACSVAFGILAVLATVISLSVNTEHKQEILKLKMQYDREREKEENEILMAQIISERKK